MRRLKPMSIPALEAEEVAPVQDIVTEENPLSIIEASEEAGTITEAELGDIDDAYETNEANLDDTLEVNAVLESLTELVNQARANGSFNETSAKLLHTSVDFITRRTGVAVTLKPSLESFDDVNHRTTNAVAVLEGLKEVAGKVWDFIVKMIEKSIAFVKELYQKIFTSTAASQKKCDDLNKKAEDIKSGSHTAGPAAAARKYSPNLPSGIDDQALAAKLAVKGHIPKDFLAEMRNYVQLSKDTIELELDFDQRHIPAMMEALTQEKPWDWDQYKTHPYRIPNVEPTRNPSEGSHKDVVKLMLDFTSITTFNNGSVRYILPSPNLSGERALAAIGQTHIMLASYASDGVTHAYLPVLPIHACEEIVREVEKLNQLIDHHKSRSEQNAAFKQDLLAYSKKIMELSQQEHIRYNEGRPSYPDSVGISGTSAVIHSFLRGITDLIDQPAFAYIRYMMRVNDSLLTYVAKCLALHDAEKARMAAG